MENIFNSATKIVLLLLTISLIGLTAFGRLDAKVFEYVITAVISFYFGQKTNVPVK